MKPNKNGASAEEVKMNNGWHKCRACGSWVHSEEKKHGHEN